MSNKAKMKCAVCHKTFNANKSSQLLCDACERNKRNKEKTQGGAVKTPQPATPKPVTVDGKPTWLAHATVRDASMPFTTEIPPELRHTEHSPRSASAGVLAKSPQGHKPQGESAATPKAPRPPRPPREPKPPLLPFVPTPEQIAAIEQRYATLAQPEFDGIRTQIAAELNIPKRVVKDTIASFRTRAHLPSWWDLQGYQGSPEELERIKVAYEAHLPAPSLGIHKEIAKELNLAPSLVYHGIGAVRQALGLPTFNPPESHPEMQREPAKADATV